MATIDNLLDDILCDVFSLIIQNSRVFPDVFKTGNAFQDCVSLIDLSRICRKWREIALTNPTLWSSVYIHLDNPPFETLRQVTHFAKICFARSRDAPLTCAISLSNLEDGSSAYPLMQAVISGEARWSRIAIDITPCLRTPDLRETPASPENEDEDEVSGEHDLTLKIAGAELLKEFHFNLGSWLFYSMSEPLPALETLRITGYSLVGCWYPLMMWAPLAPNLLELDVKEESNRFSKYERRRRRVWINDIGRGIFFVLPNLRTLFVSKKLLPNLTCPALEKFVMDDIPEQPSDLTKFLEFIERSSPPLRTIEVKGGGTFKKIPSVRGYFLPTVTNLLVTAPDYTFFDMFSDRFADGVGFLLLPGLEHLEITACGGGYRQNFSILVASRWNIGAPRRTLKSVKLRRCFRLSPIPDVLLSPPSDGINLTRMEGKWREIARCVNEGLLLSICE